MENDIQTYYVKCGNWCVRIEINPTDYLDIKDLYIEVGTKAIDYIYGDKEYDGNDELIAIYDKKNNNVINSLNELDSFLDISFTIYTSIYKNIDNKPDLKITLLTSELFANAGQWDLHQLAKLKELD
jgi:hypothetical protein